MPTPTTNPDSSGTSQATRPVDPNELLGPGGYGPKNFVSATSLLPYRINFENDPAATAPAQHVVITNPLPAAADAASFELTGLGFGDKVFTIPPGTRHWEHVEPMSMNGTDFEVRIEAGIRANGQVYANLQSIVPSTGLPPPVEIGFLPPEPAYALADPNAPVPGRGQGRGYLTYTVRPKSGQPAGTELRNIAYIVFDGQPAIPTNLKDPHNPLSGRDPNREALVTLEGVAPTLTLTLTPTGAGGTNVDARWSGTAANGFGMAGYDVSISVNGGPEQVLFTNTQQTQTTFTGYFGQQVRFRVTAWDSIGQQTTKEASIVIVDDDYLHWRAEHFGTAVEDPAQRNSLWGDDADPDGDGRTNLYEFLAATDPRVADVQFNPTTRTEGGDIIYSYHQTKVANHLVKTTLEWSPDGIHWFTGGFVSRVVGDYAGYRQLEAVLPLNGQTGIQFRYLADREVVYSHWIYEEGAPYAERSPLQDANGDGLCNALAYAYGLPAVGRVPAADLVRLPKAVVTLHDTDPAKHRGGIEFRVPEPMQPDVTLVIESSSTLSAGSWTEVARRTGSGAWAYTSPLHPSTRSQPASALATITFTEDLADRRFYRMRAVVNE